MAGIRNAAMKIVSPISRIDGVINIGMGYLRVFIYLILLCGGSFCKFHGIIY